MHGIDIRPRQLRGTKRRNRPDQRATSRRSRLRSMQLERLEERQLLATFTWDGGGTDNLWTTSANWVGDAAPTGSGTDDLVFTGTVRTANVNSYPIGATFNSIAFNSSAGAGNFTIDGNAIVLNGGVDIDSSAGNQTVNLPMVVEVATTFNVASGSLTLGGALGGSGSITKTGAGSLSFGSVVSLPTVNASGGDVSFSSQAVNTGAFTKVFTGSGPTGSVVPPGNGLLPNLALASNGGVAFSASEIGVAPHSTAGVNNGTYGNSSSWIGGGTPLVGVDLPGTTPFGVSGIAFGRANDGGFTDRSDGTYTLYRTLLPDPNSSLPITGNAATGWESMGTIVVSGNAIRKTYAIAQGGAPVAMTGLMLNTPGGAAIDELEIFGTTFGAQIAPNVNVTASGTLYIPNSSIVGAINITGAGSVVNLASGARAGGNGIFSMVNTSSGPMGNPVPTNNGTYDNIALASYGSTPFASAVIAGYAAHTIPHLNDGLYGNSNSWIGAFGATTTYAGIDLKGTDAYSVSSIAFGRTNLNEYQDRSNGPYTFYRTLVPNPSDALPITGNPTTGWEIISTVTVSDNVIKKTYSLSEDGAPVNMTGIMVSVPGENAIDEIEIYGIRSTSAAYLPNTTVNVSASATLNLGGANGDTALAAININGAGTVLTLPGPNAPGTGPVTITQLSSGPTAINVPTTNGTYDNIALASKGATAFASEVISGYAAHTIPHLNDGTYGNNYSWIGSFSNPTVAGIDLPGSGAFNVSSVAFGRNNDGTTPPVYSDRSDGSYTFYRTLVANPNSTLAITGNPNTGWEAIGTVNVAANAIKKTYSLSQSGAPVAMTGFMISVPTDGCIDEIEIYGEKSRLDLPNTAIIVSASSTLDLGNAANNRRLGVLTLTGAAGGTNFTLQNASNVTFTGIVGAGAAGTTASLSGSPTLQIAPAGTVNVATGVGLTINSVISGTTTVQKVGAGTLFLANTANTYTGETIFGGGIVNVASVSDYGIPSSIGARTLAMENNSVTGIGLHFQGGTLQYTGATAQSTNRQIRVLNGTGGSTIDASGSVAGATLSFTYSGANINLFDTGGTRTINLTGTNTGNNVFAIQVTDQAASQTSLRKAGTGTWFVTNNANNYRGETILGGGILNVSSVADYGVASAIGARQLADENTTVTGVGLHFQGGTLQYTGATAQSTNRHIRVLNGTGGSTIDASGSNAGATLSFTQSGANINLFDTGGTRTINLVGTNAGANTFALLVTDQAASQTSLRKAGSGTWFVTNNANNYRGETILGGGILNVSSVADYGVASAIGARQLVDENTSVTGVSLHFQGGTLQYTGATAQSTNRHIRVLNGAGGSTIDASGSNASATLSFTQTGPNINLFDTGGTRTINLTGTNTGNNVFAIQVTDQAASKTSLQKLGSGTWYLTNNGSTYTGETIFGGGILNVSSVSNYGVPSAIGARLATDETAPSNIGLHFRGGTLQYTGGTAQSTNRQVRILNGANGGTIDASGNNAGASLSFTYSGANADLFDTGGTRTINLVGNNTGNNVFAIQVTDQGANKTSLQKLGSGTWYLTNNGSTYTGETIFGGGILNVSSVSNYGVPSAIGARLATDETAPSNIGLHFRGGTLQYTGGTPQSTNRQVRILNGANGGTIDASGNNAGATLSFTFAGTNTDFFDTAGTRTVNLVGNNTGPNLFAINIIDQAANPTSLRKSGSGLWLISGNSTYTGGTTVAAGALRIANVAGSATGTGAVTVQSGGTLEGNGTISGNVIVQNGGTISPGNGGDTSGTLTIGNIDLQPGSTSKSDINGATSDLVRVNGNINIADGQVIPDGQITGTPSGVYVVANNLGPNPVSGAFATLPQNPAGTPFVFDGFNAVIYYNYNADTNQFFTGNDIAIVVNNPPTISPPASASVIVNEGEMATNSGTYNDIDSLDNVVITASVGSITKTGTNSGSWTWSLATTDGNAGPFNVVITATDNFGATATTSFTYTVLNVAPTLTISGASSIAEGSTYTLGLSAVDPGQDTISSWTINWGDGSPLQIVPGSPTSVTHVFANGPSAVNISATASDEDGGPYASNTLNVSVINAAPAPQLDGIEVLQQPVADMGPQTIVPGLPITFIVSTTDPAADSVDAPFEFSLDWGDGSEPTTGTATSEGEQLYFTHVYESYGSFTPVLTVVDKNLTPAGTLDLPQVTTAKIVSIDGTVYVGGDGSADRIIVSMASGAASIRINNALQAPLSVSDKIVVFGNGGNDTITVSSSMSLPVEFYGGEGNDYLAGGNGADTLDGGEGTDRLLGGNGNDVIFGGGGNDTASGGNGSDMIYGDEYLAIDGTVQMSEASGKDNLNGDAGNDFIYGHGGIDTIYGGTGNDFLRGGDDNDTIDGGDGNDILVGDAGGDKLTGRNGLDVLIGSDGFDTLLGGGGADLIYSDSLFDDSDESIQDIAALWFAGQRQDAMDLLIGNSLDDETGDNINGEADADWYAIFALDNFLNNNEKKSPNKVFNLSQP